MGNKLSYGVTSSEDFKGIVPLLNQRDKLYTSSNYYATCNFFTNHSHLESTENLLCMWCCIGTKFWYFVGEKTVTHKTEENIKQM